MSDRCLNCNQPIREIPYAMGPQWMHAAPGDSFPSVSRGTAWRHCRLFIAEPEGGVSDGR